MKKIKSSIATLLAISLILAGGALFAEWNAGEDLKSHAGFVRYHENGLGVAIEK